MRDIYHARLKKQLKEDDSSSQVALSALWRQGGELQLDANPAWSPFLPLAASIPRLISPSSELIKLNKFAAPGCQTDKREFPSATRVVRPVSVSCATPTGWG